MLSYIQSPLKLEDFVSVKFYCSHNDVANGNQCNRIKENTVHAYAEMLSTLHRLSAVKKTKHGYQTKNGNINIINTEEIKKLTRGSQTRMSPSWAVANRLNLLHCT